MGNKDPVDSQKHKEFVVLFLLGLICSALASIFLRQPVVFGESPLPLVHIDYMVQKKVLLFPFMTIMVYGLAFNSASFLRMWVKSAVFLTSICWCTACLECYRKLLNINGWAIVVSFRDHFIAYYQSSVF